MTRRLAVVCVLAGLAVAGSPVEAPQRPVQVTAEVCCATTLTQSEFLAETFPGLGEAGAW